MRENPNWNVQKKKLFKKLCTNENRTLDYQCMLLYNHSICYVLINWILAVKNWPKNVHQEKGDICAPSTLCVDTHCAPCVCCMWRYPNARLLDWNLELNNRAAKMKKKTTRYRSLLHTETPKTLKLCQKHTKTHRHIDTPTYTHRRTHTRHVHLLPHRNGLVARAPSLTKHSYRHEATEKWKIVCTSHRRLISYRVYTHTRFRIHGTHSMPTRREAQDTYTLPNWNGYAWTSLARVLSHFFLHFSRQNQFVVLYRS